MAFGYHPYCLGLPLGPWFTISILDKAVRLVLVIEISQSLDTSIFHLIGPILSILAFVVVIRARIRQHCRPRHQRTPARISPTLYLVPFKIQFTSLPVLDKLFFLCKLHMRRNHLEQSVYCVPIIINNITITHHKRLHDAVLARSPA